MGCGGGCVGGGCNDDDGGDGDDDDDGVFFLLVIPWRLHFMCRRFGTLCSIFIKYRRQEITQKKEYIIIIATTTNTTTTTTHNMDRCGKKVPFSRSWRSLSYSRNSPYFMAPKSSLPLP